MILLNKFNYNDIIEYIDATYDENFQDAKHWAQEHNTTFEELMDRRDLPKRYFQIGDEPKPYIPTEDEMKERVKRIRNDYLQQTDFTQLSDAQFTVEEKAKYAEYRKYLRDYTEEENWWLQNPKTFEEWKSLINQN